MILSAASNSVFSESLPEVVGIAVGAMIIGWFLHAWLRKPKAVATNPSQAPAKNDRSASLQNQLEASKLSNKSLKAELESLKQSTIAPDQHHAMSEQFQQARAELAQSAQRHQALEVDLKKSQSALKQLNARLQDTDKANQERRFSLENELSKVRQQLAEAGAQPEQVGQLEAEIIRLRESLATANRAAGEHRKRETLAQEALERARSSAENKPFSEPPPRVGDSDRVAAAKAEVIRLLEMNRQAKVVESNSEQPLETSTGSST